MKKSKHHAPYTWNEQTLHALATGAWKEIEVLRKELLRVATAVERIEWRTLSNTRKTQDIVADKLQEATSSSEYDLFPIRVIREAASLSKALERLEAYKGMLDHAVGFLRAEIRQGRKY